MLNASTQKTNRSYRDVLRNRHVPGLLLGDLLANAGTFTPVAYSFLQSGLEPDEQQQVVTLWTTGSMVAIPFGLVVGGPLIELAGSTGGFVLSGGLTLLLLPIAALAVLRGAPSSATRSERALRATR